MFYLHSNRAPCCEQIQNENKNCSIALYCFNRSPRRTGWPRASRGGETRPVGHRRRHDRKSDGRGVARSASSRLWTHRPERHSSRKRDWFICKRSLRKSEKIWRFPVRECPSKSHRLLKTIRRKKCWFRHCPIGVEPPWTLHIRTYALNFSNCWVVGTWRIIVSSVNSKGETIHPSILLIKPPPE